jgi:hypothetical protein
MGRKLLFTRKKLGVTEFESELSKLDAYLTSIGLNHAFYMGGNAIREIGDIIRSTANPHIHECYMNYRPKSDRKRGRTVQIVADRDGIMLDSKLRLSVTAFAYEVYFSNKDEDWDGIDRDIVENELRSIGSYKNPS